MFNSDDYNYCTFQMYLHSFFLFPFPSIDYNRQFRRVFLR